MFLRESDDGLVLVGDGMTLRGDFERMAARLKPGRLQRELIVRAAHVKQNGDAGPPRAVDATAGLGEDSLLLAAAGFDVLLFERNPTIAALLSDALERARNVPALACPVSRMHLVEADSVAALPKLGFVPDVVILDPMFPQRRKDSAVKKKLQLLQQLEEPCEDEQALLEAALAAKPRKVVIKRPAKGPYLAGRKPDYTLEGKAVRFDCIVVPPPVAPPPCATAAPPVTCDSSDPGSPGQSRDA